MVALWNRADHYVFALWFLSFFFLFLAYSKPSQTACLPYFHTWFDLSANLECRSETYCTRLAGNAGRKKSSSGHHRTILSGYIFATNTHIDNRKKPLKQQHLLHLSPQYGELQPAAEIVSLVWGTPASFNGFRVLASLLQRRRLTEANQTLYNVWPLPGLVD